MGNKASNRSNVFVLVSIVAVIEIQIFNVSYGVNPLIISALWECPPPVPITIGSKKDLWSEQISKIALQFLRFARSSLVFGGEAAELHPEFTLFKDCEISG
jgi:hypothetical protein